MSLVTRCRATGHKIRVYILKFVSVILIGMPFLTIFRGAVNAVFKFRHLMEEKNNFCTLSYRLRSSKYFNSIIAVYFFRFFFK